MYQWSISISKVQENIIHSQKIISSDLRSNSRKDYNLQGDKILMIKKLKEQALQYVNESERRKNRLLKTIFP